MFPQLAEEGIFEQATTPVLVNSLFLSNFSPLPPPPPPLSHSGVFPSLYNSLSLILAFQL